MKRFSLLCFLGILSLHGMDDRQWLGSLTRGRVHPTGRRLPTKRLTLVPIAQDEPHQTPMANGTVRKKKKRKKKKKSGGTPAAAAAAASSSSGASESWDRHVMRLLGKPYTSHEEAMQHLYARDSFIIRGQQKRDEARALWYRHSTGSSSSGGGGAAATTVQLVASLSEEDVQSRYVVGRMLLENFGGDTDYQSYAHVPFDLIRTAALAEYTPAQIYLAGSDQTGLTPRGRIVHLMHVCKRGLKKGEKKRVADLAQRYINAGYFLPLLVRISQALESGTINSFWSQLEENFPQFHIYDTDEQLASRVKLDETRWSARAISATLRVLQYVREMGEQPDACESLLPKMDTEIAAVRELHKSHPELSSLLGSCYALLGRAYAQCKKMEQAELAQQSAMQYGGEHETTLIEHLWYVLHTANGAGVAKKIKTSEKKIEALIEGAVNYKISAYLLYAAFHSHKCEHDRAEYFLQQAREQMQREHHTDPREYTFYGALLGEITGRREKKTVAGVRSEKEQMKADLQEGVRHAMQVIEEANDQAATEPLKALLALRDAAPHLFGMFHVEKSLKSRYETVLERIERAEIEDAGKEYRAQLLKELREHQKQFDVRCCVDGRTYKVPIILPRPGGGGTPRE